MMHYYPEESLDSFQFQEILNKIATICNNKNSKEHARSLRPYINKNLIQLELDKTSDFLSAFREQKHLPQFEYPNLEKHFGILSIDNAVLDTDQLIDVRKAFEYGYNSLVYFNQNKEFYPTIYNEIKDIEKDKIILNIIDEVLESNGQIKDKASPELYDIRSSLSGKRNRANRLFLNAIKKYQKLGYLVDFNESFYNNRRVLAVFSEFKREINGIVHSSSETGKTTYIEPASCITINNEVAELEILERREIAKILNRVTNRIRIYKDLLRQYTDVLDELDFLESKAKFAKQIDASKPSISKKDTLRLKKAFHPLLLLLNKELNKNTIPLSCELSNHKRIIIISGPNAGGKSIALKTIGIHQLMFQCGLYTPAEEGEFPIVNNLLVDIGDDQSIEAELSTYSSRLKKMKYFLRVCNSKSLFLIDEFGTGSDPELGGAMAESFLEEFYKSEAKGIVTTHYSNIKILGEKLEGVANASMLFNKSNLSPLYELQVGIPGSSYTFEVAQKIGLNKTIIETAKQKVDENKVQLDSILVRLQNERRRIKSLEKKLNEKRSNFNELRIQYENKLQELDQKNKASGQKRADQNRLFELGEKYEKLFDRYLKGEKKKSVLKSIEMALDAELLKKKKEEERKRTHKKSLKKKGPKKEETLEYLKEKIKPGTKVKLKNQRTVGIVEKIEGEQVVVTYDLMKLKVNITELRIVIGGKN